MKLVKRIVKKNLIMIYHEHGHKTKTHPHTHSMMETATPTDH